MIKIAELKFKILGDLKQLKSDIQKLVKEKFNIGVEGGVGTGGGKGGKGGGILGSILKALAPLVILLSLKPIQQILELTFAILTFALLKILKFFGLFDLGGIESKLDDTKENISNVGEATRDAIDEVSSRLDNLKGNEQLNELINMEKILEANGIKIADGIVENADTIRDILEKNGIDTAKFSDQFLVAIDKGMVDIQEVLKGVGDGIKDKVAGVDSSTQSVKDQVKESTDKMEDQIKLLEKANFWLSFMEKLLSVFQFIKDKIAGFFGFGGGSNSNPDDTITSTQPSGGGGNKTIIMQGVQPQELIDVIRREFAVDPNESSRF